MRFATDATVGKLGRYLRSAGFDTLCQHQSRRDDFFETLDGNRVILTRMTQLQLRYSNGPLVFVRENDPVRQMMQVVGELSLGWCDVNPFSRCLECNEAILQLDREAVTGKVPAYVWQCHQRFYTCGRCGRIYWAGSHHDRMVKRLSAIFQRKDEKNP